jgi:demethylmenaquinone methyltransferase / 2-methoxy-6-polyprenyl-1,4-benzoquinol methylase
MNKVNTESLSPVSRGGNGGSGAMFDLIATRYDRVNRILSLGLDQRWRRTTLRKIGLTPEHRVLDIATGTGDLAILQAQTTSSVVGLDPSQNMLDVAQSKLDSQQIAHKVQLVLGDAQALPFEDAEFDRITIAFGIRNVPDRIRGMREMLRVLKSGGKVGILELNEPEKGLLALGARFYIRKLVPRIGAALSGAREYRYLQESIAEFPNRETFAQSMKDVGFSKIESYPLSFGVCTLFVGHKD